MRTVHVGVRLAVSALVLGAASGCSVEAAEVGEDESVASQAQALRRDLFYDSTRRIEIQVKTCGWSTLAQVPSATCTVDAGYVLVGGGAEVEGEAAGGGLLTHSGPANTFYWAAASKAHITPLWHRIRAYAVGMKLSGMSEATLRSLVTITRRTSAVSSRPTASVSIPYGHVLLSGGAFVTANGPGMLLTESYPTGGTSQWTASAKDHQAPDAGTVTTSVLSIPECLNDQWAGGGCLLTSILHNNSPASSGYHVENVTLTGGGAPVGAGARARWSLHGRYLTDLHASVGVGLYDGKLRAVAWAYSKDHNLAESNVTDLWMTSVSVF